MQHETGFIISEDREPDGRVALPTSLSSIHSLPHSCLPLKLLLSYLTHCHYQVLMTGLVTLGYCVKFQEQVVNRSVSKLSKLARGKEIWEILHAIINTFIKNKILWMTVRLVVLYKVERARCSTMQWLQQLVNYDSRSWKNYTT